MYKAINEIMLRIEPVMRQEILSDTAFLTDVCCVSFANKRKNTVPKPKAIIDKNPTLGFDEIIAMKYAEKSIPQGIKDQSKPTIASEILLVLSFILRLIIPAE